MNKDLETMLNCKSVSCNDCAIVACAESKRMTKAAATTAIYSLGDTSKMPESSYGLSASKCITGRKLAKIAGTVCSGCYAMEGKYPATSVQKSHAGRLACWQRDPASWIAGMVRLLENTRFFRWFDSGDLQSPLMAKAIVTIAWSLPNTRFWLPTRETSFISRFSSEIPDNLTVRLSSNFPDRIRKVANGFQTSTVISGKVSLPEITACHCHEQGNKCLDCRACWSKEIHNIGYLAHGNKMLKMLKDT